MVGRYVRMTAQPEQGTAVAEPMLAVADSLRDTTGCRLYAVNRAVGDPDEIWITEVWDSPQDIGASLAFLQSEAGQARQSELMGLLDRPPQRTDLEPLGGVGLGD